jgi:oligopeptide/dipeptide ABC transporter ATP-binding protein
MVSAESPLLDVRHLTTVIDVGRKRLRAVDDVGLVVRPGETLGLVGESGCGKSMTALSILRLVQPPCRIADGRVLFEGRDLLQLPERDIRQIRGSRLALIPQDPSSALNPVFTIGDQLAETMRVHGATRREAGARAIALLQAVRIPGAERRVRDYPHQLSGGLAQRVLVAMAIACRPRLVIADEPTSALDTTVQAQILDLLRDLRSEFRLSLLLITHDLGVLAAMADRVAVMYAGRVVEQGSVRAICGSAAHPYTRALLASLPAAGARRRLQGIDGNVPRLDALPPGCAFAPRCPDRVHSCGVGPPMATPLGVDREVRCCLYEGIRLRPDSTTGGGTPTTAGASRVGATEAEDGG